MTTIEELEIEIKQCEQNISDIRNNKLIPAEVALKKVKQNYAEEKCFCKVGDKIQKKNDPFVIVSRVLYAYEGFSLRAYKIKKNGEPYKEDHAVFEWSDNWDEWKLL